MLSAMDQGPDLSSLRIAVFGRRDPTGAGVQRLDAKDRQADLDGIGSTELPAHLHYQPGRRCRARIYRATSHRIRGQGRRRSHERKPRGEIGRLAVRGPTGCRYLADERQKTYVREGWNLTGDAFWQDDNGYFHFAARTDDMIISAGYNIAGPEVEAALLSHPDVKECAVIGHSRTMKRGQVVQAHVVLKDGVVDRCGHRSASAESCQGVDRAVQVSAVGEVHRCTAQDANRQDPAFQTAHDVQSSEAANDRCAIATSVLAPAPLETRERLCEWHCR